jgi:hypothetical protein
MAREALQKDGVQQIWDRFLQRRMQELYVRFPGIYRAIVVETNDPLRHHRIRVKVPELHNFDLKPEECPWAVISQSLGGSGSGAWVSPIIGDLVWVQFEKGHPYSIIVTGFANPTRRKFYVLESVYGKTPVAVDTTGKSAGKPTPDDFIEEYLPKDGRPMSLGWRDRYGSFLSLNSVGFFPKEHDVKAAPVGTDAISQGEFDTSKEKPAEDDPDTKGVALCSKYGNFLVISDVGYRWKKNDKEQRGEFEGDFDADREFEVKRSNFLRRLFNEDKPSKRDQRRIELRTRYGHKFEMRDVGWGHKEANTRQDEYGDPTRIAEDTKKDERWVKIRTKGGHLIQMWDKGSDPLDDAYVKRSLLKEVGGATEIDQEDQWQSRKDARQIRIVTRYGFKFVLDDRGSDPKNATGKTSASGNGLLIKGRRAIPDDEARGFGVEFNEKDQVNAAKIYTPKSKLIEFNDRFDYIMLCTDTNGKISRPWRNLFDNEFTTAQAMTFDPERDTYHLKLDKANGYIRLVTALQQGLEMRDGIAGEPWVELRDVDDRGMWFSRDHDFSVWRAKKGTNMFIMMDDGAKGIFIQNKEDGAIHIASNGSVQIKAAGDITLDAGGNINLRARNQICMEAAGAHAVLQSGQFGTDVRALHPSVVARALGCSIRPIGNINRPIVAPDEFDQDRGFVRQNKLKDFKEIDVSIIRGE